jgi:hypothetical protein
MRKKDSLHNVPILGSFLVIHIIIINLDIMIFIFIILGLMHLEHFDSIIIINLIIINSGISTGCEGTCTESVKLIECFLWGNYAEIIT